jgi:hypothetical protein
MARQWGYEMPAAPAVVVRSPAASWPGARRGRFGRAGMVGLVCFILWLLAGRTAVAAGAPRPRFIMVGWDVILDMLELHGQAPTAFRLALGGLWVALPASLATGAFRHGPWWRPVANLAIGLAGLLAAVPVLTVVGVVLANLVLWGMAVMLGLLVFMTMLLRILLAPLRRW